MKKLIIVLALLLVSLSVAGCGTVTSQQMIHLKTQEMGRSGSRRV